MNARTCRTLMTLAGITLVLAACSSAPTRMFTLFPVAPTTCSTYTGPAIRVDAVHMPVALDRIEVVSDIAPGELRINDLDHWSAPLSQQARQTLSADLITRLPPGRVIFPHLEKPDGTLGVTVEVLEFTTGHAGATLQASWVISATDPRPITIRGTAELRTDEAQASAPATANGLSNLLGQLADRIAAQLASQDHT
jgi:uncharacterized lipoprotein YmbA